MNTVYSWACVGDQLMCKHQEQEGDGDDRFVRHVLVVQQAEKGCEGACEGACMVHA